MAKEEFDFSSLGGKTPKKEVAAFDKDAFKKQLMDQFNELLKKINAKEMQAIRRDMDNRVAGFNSNAEANLRNFRADINKSMMVWHDRLKQELEVYKEDAYELWSQIYPTIIKMWGNRKGIGLAAFKLNMLLEKEKEDSAMNE